MGALAKRGLFWCRVNNGVMIGFYKTCTSLAYHASHVLHRWWSCGTICDGMPKHPKFEFACEVINVPHVIFFTS